MRRTLIMEIIRKSDNINTWLLQKSEKNIDDGIEKENIYMRTLIDTLKKRDFKFLQHLAAFDRGWSFSGYSFFTRDGKDLY
jgi:hypothetical protein